MKNNQIPYVIFQATSQFSFKFCITLQCHDTYFLWNFLAFGQKEPIKVKFSDFWVVRWKSTKFLKSYFKLQVSFSLNFVSSVSWKLHVLQFLFVGESNKQRRGRIISNFTKGDPFHLLRQLSSLGGNFTMPLLLAPSKKGLPLPFSLAKKRICESLEIVSLIGSFYPK